MPGMLKTSHNHFGLQLKHQQMHFFISMFGQYSGYEIQIKYISYYCFFSHASFAEKLDFVNINAFKIESR